VSSHTGIRDLECCGSGLVAHESDRASRTGSGTKGTRHYDWAMLEVTSDNTADGHDGGHSVLLARRHRYNRQAVLLPLLDTGPGPAGPADRCRGSQVADRGRSSADEAGHRPGRRAGHPLEVLAPLDVALPAGLYLPPRRRGSATPARGRRRSGGRTGPDHRSGAAAATARHRHPATARRSASPAALAHLATTPSAPRPPSAPALECLRRDNTMMRTSCRRRLAV
jgi:hypothetical protein